VLAVDTNVLVYGADADSQFHTACRDWLERQRARPDAGAILYEFLRVTTHGRVMRRPFVVPPAQPALRGMVETAFARARHEDHG
jgi:predicted nucleic acid-binding protein